MLFLKTLDKNNAGKVSTILQNHICLQISYYALSDLLYDIIKIDERDKKHKNTHTETIICICTCVYVYLCVYACIDSMLVCVHIHICMPKIKNLKTPQDD